MAKTIFVMGDGNEDNDYGHWVGVYVDGELVHQGKWPIPFPVLQKILEADVTQVSITVPDGKKFAAGQGLPDSYEDLGNTANVRVIGTMPYVAKVEKYDNEAQAARERIINNMREILMDPKSTPRQMEQAQNELKRLGVA